MVDHDMIDHGYFVLLHSLRHALRDANIGRAWAWITAGVIVHHEETIGLGTLQEFQITLDTFVKPHTVSKNSGAARYPRSDRHGIQNLITRAAFVPFGAPLGGQYVKRLKPGVAQCLRLHRQILGAADGFPDKPYLEIGFKVARDALPYDGRVSDSSA